MLLGTLVNMDVFVGSSLICATASRRAYNSSCKMLGYLGSRDEIFVCNERNTIALRNQLCEQQTLLTIPSVIHLVSTPHAAQRGATSRLW